jgi:thiamine transport system ATP-binding protein
MLSIENVSLRYEQVVALSGVSLDIHDGEVVAVLGASGSGKTSILRVVAGLERADTGRVLLDGVDLTPVPPHRRGIGLVFQEHVLFRHLDVAGNVAFGLRMRGDRTEAIERRVGELLDLVGLAGYENREVTTLSGGEQQRIALARALAPEPRVLLLDEPLGSLDRPLRERLLEDLATVFDKLRVTAIYVTHDQAEAFALGDRVAVMGSGRIEQVEAPDELWARPVSESVARFLGSGNVRDGAIVRPEAVAVQRALDDGDGVVERAVRHGPVVRLTIRLDDGSRLDAATTALDHPTPGDRVSIEVDPAGIVPL